MRLKFTGLVVALAFAQVCFCQETINVNEAAAIRYASEQLVSRNLKALLNFISDSEMEPDNIKRIISNSYASGFNQVFDSSIVVIEDDIDPTHTYASPKEEVQVSRYLKDFDLVYSKSPNGSVVLNVLRVSNVKRNLNNTYVKVYFTSFFRNTSKTVDAPYSINNRVAEVSVKRVDNRWAPLISSISFFKPEDTLTDVENDLVLERNASETILDSAAIAQQQKTFEQQLREKQELELIENEKKTNAAFDKLVGEGDKLFAAKDYVEALKKYNEAKALKEYDKAIYARISKTMNEKERAKRDSDQLYDDYLRAARLAQRKRDFKEALTSYRKAKDENPSRAVEFEKEFQTLDIRYSNIEKMEEMYKIGKFKDAINEYSSLIKKNKTYSDYYLGRGKCYEQTDDDSKALKDYGLAIEYDRDNVQAYINRAGVYKRKKDYVNAITDHGAAIRIINDNPVNYLELAELRILNNNPRKEAIQVLEEGLKVEALQKTPELYLNKGLLLADDQSWKNAIADFTAVVSLDTNHAFGYYNRGLCYLQVKQVENAALDFESARNKGLEAQYVGIIANIAEGYFDNAMRLYDNKSIDSAINRINAAIAIHPANDKFRYYKGNYYMSLAKYREAIQCFDQAIGLNKSHTDAYFKRGLSYHALASYPTAIENFKSALGLNGQYILVIKSLGDAYFVTKDYSNAAVQYESAIKLLNAQKGNNDAILAEVYNSLGKSYYHLNDYEKATAALRSAIRKKELFPEALFYRGVSYYKWNKLDDAITDLNKAVSLENNHAVWCYYQARAHQDDKKNMEAAQFYSAAIKLDTAHALNDAVYLRGKCYYDMNQYESALADYLAAQTLHADTAFSSFNYELGVTYLNTKNPEAAIACFKKEPADNGLLAYKMGTALLLQGKADDSLVWFEKALQSKMVSEREMKRDKLIETIQNDKRFKDLLKKY